jgi:hypothetical protein
MDLSPGNCTAPSNFFAALSFFDFDPNKLIGLSYRRQLTAYSPQLTVKPAALLLTVGC